MTDGRDPLFRIDVPFRGHRDYLHSASIFDFLVSRTSASEDLFLSFKRMFRGPIGAFPPDPGLPGYFKAKGVEFSIGEIDGPDPLREPYDEDARILNTELSPGRALDLSGEGTICERFVAMNKRLVQLAAEPKGPVIFGSIRLNRLPWPGTPLGVVLERSARGFHHSQLEAAHEPVGEMVFYAV